MDDKAKLKSNDDLLGRDHGAVIGKIVLPDKNSGAQVTLNLNNE